MGSGFWVTTDLWAIVQFFMLNLGAFLMG
ncbi:hypothetical protein Golax_016928 [Gossypium laxum]|uniref:Uncharacterized protein n=1 Tax=Gossypium laxum TaxID=34288 RepID=A0A7J8YYQ0_9ROSI|nr:hypothetical protein [Gossypium laxum]